MNWKPITDDEPQEGQPVVLYNGVRPFTMTGYKPVVASSLAKHPATHFCALELPYAPVETDMTSLEREIVERMTRSR